MSRAKRDDVAVTRDKLRNRFAGEVRAEVKRVALRQLADGGPDAISVNAIARELEVSGPALYRYYAGRDDLLTEMIVDAYDDLDRAVRDATARPRTARAKLIAFVAGYRGWAVEQPHRYRLLYRAPLPGYDAHSESLALAAQQSMNLLLDILEPDRAPSGRGSALERQLGHWLTRRGRPAELARAAEPALRVWSRLHGLVSLEIDGNFASIGVDADALYAIEFADLVPTGATVVR